MNKKVLGVLFASLMIIAFGSCKPKQSAYKSVYEAAKEREVEEDVSYEPISRPATNPSAGAVSSNASVKKEKITPVYESDASGLKAYNVVIAAMGMKPNAESLKARMQQAGYSPILVQNQEGMYRVIISSTETKDAAVAKRSEILASFFQEGDAEALRVKYGIPFNDWWILERSY